MTGDGTSVEELLGEVIAMLAEACTPPGSAEWLTAVDAGGLRHRAGISLQTLSRALGVPVISLWAWENGRKSPTGKRGEAYCRFIAGLARHEEVPAEPAGVPGSRKRNAPGLAA